MRFPNRRSGRGVFEVLEGRRMLSGNVSATYDAPSNTLSIIGDNKSNQIVVHYLPVPGPVKYEIVPLPGTTVNGSATPVDVPVSGPAKINADMGNGDDDITLDIPSIGGLSFDTTINTGNGNDEVSMNNWTVIGKLSIDTGNGDDDVYISGGAGQVVVTGDLNVNTGRGDDEVTIDAPLDVVGTATLDGGNGFDVLTGKTFLTTNPTTLSILNFESVT